MLLSSYAANADDPLIERIEVSPELTTLIGCGRMAGAEPRNAFALGFSLGTPNGQPTLWLNPSATDEASPEIILLVDRDALARLGGRDLIGCNQYAFHLPSALRSIALVLREPPVHGEARTAYRLAKSIELICETIRLFEDGDLVAAPCDGALSEADSRRLAAARRMIDERWNEKLTLDQIGRACGLNRAKLTRGFREMFNCSIAEALAERRLLEARRLLLTTDLPVSSVGYESGYLNNASFSRAFGRHFGRSPSDYRAVGVAA